jgi:hypothetical protein
MINNVDAPGIAERIRGLIAGQDQGVTERTARRLGVSEVALRISIDEIEPHPAIEVILAVVREYGVDPSWLLTGEYDPVSHRQALDDEAEYSQSSLARLLNAKATPPHAQRAEPPDLRLEA